MNIILGEEQAQALADRYTILSLDTFLIKGQIVRSFCVVENLPITEMPTLDICRELHENLMTNYALRNWNYCEQAIDYLMGRWNRELDTFYLDLARRIQDCKQRPQDDWTPVITRSVEGST